MWLAKNSSSRRLELEVTERLLLEDNDGTLAAMEQLKNLGVGISLDDFDTGYSSLNVLRKLPVQEIKIDQSFIAGLGEERDAQAIIGAGCPSRRAPRQGRGRGRYRDRRADEAGQDTRLP
jgi:EAL domain-containing protein (putative c-di-GMP-specific phosphodiesterase class I)